MPRVITKPTTFRRDRQRHYWAAILVLIGTSCFEACQLTTAQSQNDGTAQIAAKPASISFGNVQIGTSQTLAGAITNTGQSSVTVTQITTTGSAYSVSGIGSQVSLVGGQTANFSVLFSPNSAGTASGNIAFATSSGTVNVSLSGAGISPGDLTTNPKSIDFGTVLVNDAISQIETLTNTGGVALTVTAATVSGSGFSYAGLSLPLTLAPNQAAQFSVSFAPMTAGASNGDLELTVSGSATVDIALSGTGVLPGALTASPSSLTFADVPVGQSSTQTESLKNTGGSSVQISQVAASGAGFSISGISPPVTLAAGQSTSFSVTFAPQSGGSASGSVTVTSNAQNPSLNVSLSGTGEGATGSLSVSTPINVGSVVEGLSGTQTGTLTASGASVVVSSVSMGGADAAEFSISGLSFPVTVTTSQPVSFTVTFMPTATGTASATATFTSNASDSSDVATLTGSGTAAPTHTVQLSWTASTSGSVTTYNVYRALYQSDVCGVYTNIGSTPSSVTSYMDSTVSDGTTYCYATTAVDPDGESEYSNIAQATIPAP